MGQSDDLDELCQSLAEKMLEIFKRDIYQYDITMYAKHGIPKFKMGESVRYQGSVHTVTNVLWSEHFYVWTYRVDGLPKGSSDVFLSEKDLTKVRKRKGE